MKGYLSQGSLQNPHGHSTEILTDQVGVPVGERWPRLRPALRVSSAHGCSKKPTQPLLLPKRNKMKVLFNKTESPKQSLSVAQLTATSEHRLVLCSARAAWGLLVRAAGQVSGAAWRCSRLPRGRRWPGTAGGGDSRRAAGRHVTGLGGSEQPGQTKLPEPCGAADVRAPSPGAPGYRPAPCLCPEDGPGPCVGPPLAQHPQNIGEMF